MTEMSPPTLTIDRSEREFSVVMLPASGEERFFVDGRCLGSPISVGDVFYSVYRMNREASQGSEEMLADPRRVDLRVDEIYSHSKQVQSLKSGEIARLYLSGAGQEILKKGDVLGEGRTEESV